MAFQTSRRVEFRDTDAAGIVHFSAFFPMMEVAEHEMLRSVGIQIMPKPTDGAILLTWPRVAASCDYLSAARFEDLLTIDVQVVRIGTSSIRYGFQFTCEDRKVAQGSVTVVSCQLEAHGALKKTPVPDEIRELLATYQ